MSFIIQVRIQILPTVVIKTPATSSKSSFLKKLLLSLCDRMTLILLIAAVISFIAAVIGGESKADTVIILAIVVINGALGVIQESKAEAAIEALQTMTAATCKVIRDGKQITLHSDELVPGDVVLLEAGDAVPADGRIIECASLKIEEAALTGESVPVNKMIDALNLTAGQEDVPLGDRKNMCYMGSTVVYGRGKAVVVGTGCVDYPRFIPALLDLGFAGDLTIEREITGEQQIKDILYTKDYLNKLLDEYFNK